MLHESNKRKEEGRVLERMRSISDDNTLTRQLTLVTTMSALLLLQTLPWRKALWGPLPALLALRCCWHLPRRSLGPCVF